MGAGEEKAMDEWTSNEDVEPEMAAMGQADIVWMEMEWDRMERQEMVRKKVETAEAHGCRGRAVLAARPDSANSTARR